jgi:hypothetical protein
LRAIQLQPQFVESLEPLQAAELARSARLQDLEALAHAYVRRVAWGISRDGRCATARIEIGAGPLQGSSIVICADLRDVRVVFHTPPGVDLEVLKNRLSRRLASRGLAATFD